VRASRLFLLRMLVAVAGGCISSPAAPQNADIGPNADTPGGDTLRVNFSNQAAASESDILLMATVAGQVLGKAGITVRWSFCFDQFSQRPADSSCIEKPDVPVFFLTLVEDSRTNEQKGLGLAVLGTGRASVYYRRAETLAKGMGNVSAGQILGYAAVHEIVHLILASHDHSASGLMRSGWKRGELRDIGQNHFSLTRSESSIVRRALAQRTLMFAQATKPHN